LEENPKAKAIGVAASTVKISVSREGGEVIIACRDARNHSTLQITQRGAMALLALLERAAPLRSKQEEAEHILVGQLSVGVIK
jgi:hypothetical protein